jgi:putative transcriptional regulator
MASGRSSGPPVRRSTLDAAGTEGHDLSMATELSPSPSLLVATPRAPRALHGTVLLHGLSGPEGALGWVLNRPLSLRARDVLGAFGVAGREATVGNAPLLAGGHEHRHSGWLLFDLREGVPMPRYSVHLTEHIGLTASPEAFTTLLDRPSVPAYHLLRGYVGWAPGQLAAELSAGAFLVMDAMPSIVFDTPAELRFAAALEAQGASRAFFGDLTFAEA